MTTVALDASTILAWARKERGWQAIDRLLRTPPARARFALPGTALTEVITVLRDASIIAVSERLEANVLTGDTYWSTLSEAGHLRIQAILFPRDGR